MRTSAWQTPYRESPRRARIHDRAARVPAALLFAASANGVSHAPGEAIDYQDLTTALTLLAALLPKLASNHVGGKA